MAWYFDNVLFNNFSIDAFLVEREVIVVEIIAAAEGGREIGLNSSVTAPTS